MTKTGLRIANAWIFIGQIGIIHCKTFRVGALMTSGLPPLVSIESIAPAMKLAIEDFQNKGSLTEHDFQINWIDDQCLPKLGVHFAVQAWRNDDIDVLIGSLCSRVVAAVSHYLTVWDFPIFTHGGAESVLNDKITYNTLVRLSPGYNKLGIAMVELLKNFGWNKTALVHSDEPICEYGAEVFHKMFPLHGITITEWIKASPQPTDAQLDDYLHRIEERARIILLCLTFEDASSFVLRAHEYGMNASEFVILFYTTYPLEEFKKPWLINIKPNLSESEIQKRKEAYYSFKVVWMAGIASADVSKFRDKIPTRLFEEPWMRYNNTFDKNVRGSIFSVFLYEATYTYLHLLNESLQEGGNYRSGTYMFNKARNKTFQDILGGTVNMDDAADREPDFRMLYYKPGNDELLEDFEISLVKPAGQRVYSLYNDTYWGTPDNSPPPDTPPCGFHHDLCKEKRRRKITEIAVPVASLLITIMILGGIFINYRKRKFEAEINQMIWKISFEDVKRTKKIFGSMMAMSLKSFQDHDSRSNSGKSIAENQVFIEQGEFRGTIVAIKFIPLEKFVPNRQNLMELKILKQMNHTNVNPFIGACTDPPNTCILSQYCTKGSLQDILENDDIPLEWMFRISLIMDLTKGLLYLHNSPLLSHGRLSSSNCLVDNRWVLKISSFGLQGLLQDQKSSAADINEYRTYRRMLWTAPELLRMSDKPRNGTQKGDVYSYAIILQEVLYREQPFFLQGDSPKDIIDKVVQVRRDPFRPNALDTLSEKQKPAIDLMRSCWAENPNERPDFAKCLRHLKKSNKGHNVNLMDIMVQKLEKYANNLEDVIGQRTRELVDEKKKTDALLHRMLPKSVAEQLKKGTEVKPQLYSDVTIFFSDIVGFTSLSSESTPIQIIDLLNDLYTLFDDIIEQHDVYKVETIGDAYMVVSGLPERNGNRHAPEIATMALDLLRTVSTNFRIRHQPTRRLELRSGIHTGPCAAGVVGLTMPRYCLFGDSVNVASRMESNGEALKIHLSSSTYQCLRKAGGFIMEVRGEMEIKGKGIQTTFWLRDRKGEKE